ncbi:MAG: hypothetical protein ABI440_01405 [Casimicrobiaceae bacterium]
MTPVTRILHCVDGSTKVLFPLIAASAIFALAWLNSAISSSRLRFGDMIAQFQQSH